MEASKMGITEEIKLHPRLTSIFIEQSIRPLLHCLCLGWMVGSRYGDDIKFSILQNLQALEEWRNRSFIIQRGRVIVKIIAFLYDFLLFSPPEHGKHDGKIHASLLPLIGYG